MECKIHFAFKSRRSVDRAMEQERCHVTRDRGLSSSAVCIRVH